MLARIPLGLLVNLFIATLTVVLAGPFLWLESILVNTGDIQIHLHRRAGVVRASA